MSLPRRLVVSVEGDIHIIDFVQKIRNKETNL